MMASEVTFPLEHATELGCRIDKYSIGHSELWIRVNNDQGFQFYLYFALVKYLSAPMQMWQSANFSISEAKECEKLLSRIGYPQELCIRWARDYNLYEVKNEGFTLQIIARGVSKITEDILGK